MQKFSFAALWQEAFRRTYRTEFRSESPEYSRALYEASPDRYERATRLALARLREAGVIQAFAVFSGAVEVDQSAGTRRAARWRWQCAWPIAKGLALVRLLKTATTFGDWLPYALWKLERHSGARPQLSERQRRHPLIFGWPVIFRLLGQRSLR